MHSLDVEIFKLSNCHGIKVDGNVPDNLEHNIKKRYDLKQKFTPLNRNTGIASNLISCLNLSQFPGTSFASPTML